MAFVCLLAGRPDSTLYVGSTFDLLRRMAERKVRVVPGFTAKYGIDQLVWYETHDMLEGALIRERQIKK